MAWLGLLYAFLLGLGFTAAGIVTLQGVDRTWGGLLLVLPGGLLLLWLGLHSLVGSILAFALAVRGKSHATPESGSASSASDACPPGEPEGEKGETPGV
jgi:hypothetical protein